MQAYADVVFNHKDGGDEVERVRAQIVDWDDRNRRSQRLARDRRLDALQLPRPRRHPLEHALARGPLRRPQLQRRHHNSSRLYRIKDKPFETEVSHEHGNYDYLMACDLDTRHPEVDGELRWWGRWIVDTTGVDGFRIDAVKHIRASFFRDWLNHLRVHFGGRELFAVGEYWSGNVADLHGYITATEGVMSLFDVPLHYRFCDASRAGNSYDLRTIFDGTLVGEQPAQGGHVRGQPRHPARPVAGVVGRAVVQAARLRADPAPPGRLPVRVRRRLLRRRVPPTRAGTSRCYSHRFLIDHFLFARRSYGFGDQHDYFDHPNTIGWLRTGDAEHPGAMAVVMTNGSAGRKWMNTFRPTPAFATEPATSPTG